MTFSEVLVIGSGLAIGYWLVGVFLPHARSGAMEDEAASPEQESPPYPELGADRDAHLPWHQVLGVQAEAGHDEIAAVYKRLIAQYHPDKVATMAPEIRDLAQRRSAQINAAYGQAMGRRRTQDPV